MSKFYFSNKNIIITGAADGLGKAISDELYYKRNNLFCVDIDEKKLKSLQIKNPSIKIFKTNLSNLKDTENLIKELEKLNIKFDVLINCAGYEIGSLINEVPEEEFYKNFNCNFFSPFLLIKFFIQNSISEHKKKIINMVSDTAFRAIPTRTSYCSSKAALNSLTESLRLELKIFNIDVINVIPPKLDTNFFKKIKYFGKLNLDKIYYSDSRPFYSHIKFSKQVIKETEKGKMFIYVFSITKLFTFLNYLLPKVADILVEKLSSWKKIKRKI